MTNEYLNILVKVNKETGELDVIRQQLSNLDGTTKGTTKSVDAMGSAFSSIKQLLPIISLAAFVNQLKQSIDEAENMNEVIRRLSFSLESNSINVKDNIDLLKQQAEHVQNVSRVSSEQYLSSITKVLNMTGNLNTAQRIVNASMGISLKTGIELSSAMMYLSQAANNNEFGLTRLSRSGLSAYIDKSKTAKENAEKLVSMFEGLYRDTNSLTGQKAQLVNYFDDIKKAMGQLLIPSMLSGFKQIRETLQEMEKVPLVASIQDANVKLQATNDMLIKSNNGIIRQQDYIGENSKYWDDETKKIENNKLERMKENNTRLKESQKIAENNQKEQVKALDVVSEKMAKENAGLITNNNNKNLSTEADKDREKEKNRALEELNKEYNIKLAQLDNDKILVKQLSDAQEIDTEKAKLYETITGNKSASKLIVDNWIKENKRKYKEIAIIDKQAEKQQEITNKQIVADKLNTAQEMFSITKNFIEAGLILAGSEFKKRKEWAIAMIVLEKSIAIMSAIRGAIEYSGTHPALAIASAAGTIALITAQAVQQINAISKASSSVDSSSGISSTDNNNNPLQNEQSGNKIGGSSFGTGNTSIGGSESGRNIVTVHFNVIDPTSLTTDAQEKVARWLKNVLDNENKR